MKIDDVITINDKNYPLIRDATPEEMEEAKRNAYCPTTKTRIKSGEFFSADGKTYRSKTTIPAGDMIVPGTNCSEIDITDLLNTGNK